MANEEQKTKIQLEVYDEVIEVNIVKGEEEMYRDAAKFVTDRIGIYAERHRGWKCQSSIFLMTMLDIALNPMKKYECKNGHRSIWRKIVEYIKTYKYDNTRDTQY